MLPSSNNCQLNINNSIAPFYWQTRAKVTFTDSLEGTEASTSSNSYIIHAVLKASLWKGSTKEERDSVQFPALGVSNWETAESFGDYFILGFTNSASKNLGMEDGQKDRVSAPPQYRHSSHIFSVLMIVSTLRFHLKKGLGEHFQFTNSETGLCIPNNISINLCR